MKKVIIIFCICPLFFGCISTETSSGFSNQSSQNPIYSQTMPVQNILVQNRPEPLKGEALLAWFRSTLERYSEYPEKKSYPVYDLRMAKMSISNWSYPSNRFSRFRFSGTVKEFTSGNGLVYMEITSGGLTEGYLGKDNSDFSGINIGDFLNVYVNYVLDGATLGEFVEMFDVLDRPNVQEWVFNTVTYTKATLQEALRITRNEGRSGKKYNFWIRDIDYIFGGGYFLLKTGTTELALVEYYGEDLANNRGHGGVLFNIDCTGITPKVTAIKFFEYPSQK